MPQPPLGRPLHEPYLRHQPRVTMAAKNCANLDAAGADPIEQYASGNSGLINKGNGDYQFNWTTTKGTSGCQILTLTLPNEYPSTLAKLEAYLQFNK